MIGLEEMKQYLRVGFDDDDELIESLLETAAQTVLDILREHDESVLENEPNAKTAMLYTVAYLYEHREDANYSALMMTLRALLFGSRKVEF